MGHYDSSSEDLVERQLRKKAEALGITTYQYVALEKHNYKMKEGEKLLKQKKVEEELIAYYLSNSEERCHQSPERISKMSKEFPEWPFNIFAITLIVIMLLIGGLWVYESHPYEVCKIMYETPEDISECVWIKENP